MNQSYPTLYAEDLKEIDGDMGKVVTVCETVTKKDVEETKNLWEMTFDQPYEKAGGEIGFNLNGVVPVQPPVYWDVSDTDVNTKYKSVSPRFLLEVSLALSLSLLMFDSYFTLLT